jgi:acyl-coenzyme A thioesterase PaaI-like protein
MRRPPMSALIGRCRILKLGRRLAVAEVAITAENDPQALLAQATATYSIPT